MGVQYDAKDLATLVTSVMKVLRQKLDDCRVYFQVSSECVFIKGFCVGGSKSKSMLLHIYSG